MDDQDERNELTTIRRILAAVAVLAVLGGGVFVVAQAQANSARHAREQVRQLNDPYNR